jgi:flagellar hook-length control protein FliK
VPATQVVVAGGPPTPVVEVVAPAQAENVVALPAPAAAAPAIVVDAAPGAAAAAQSATVETPDAPDAAAPVATATAPAAKPAPVGQANGETKDQGGQGQPKPDNQAAPAPAQQARVAAAYARPAEPQQPQAAAPAASPAPATAPATAAAPAQAATPTIPTATPVPLNRSAEAVEHVLRLASARGVTHARIALRPAELGSIDVHIRSTAEGLVARVVAHTAEAVQTLQNAANDLRQSLEEQGLTLMSLDIGQPGDRSAGRAGADADDGKGGGDSPSAAESDDAPTQTSTLRLPTGVLVDVLA